MSARWLLPRCSARSPPSPKATSLAANQLVLRDHGRRPREEVPGKTIGSVHGDSIGVHASDSANAWRNMARVSNARNVYACLILGAYQVALDRSNRGGDFLNWQPMPVPRLLNGIKTTEPGALLRDVDDAIRNNLQSRGTQHGPTDSGADGLLVCS